MFEQVESANIGRLEESQTYESGSCLECGGREYHDPDAEGRERSLFFCVDCGAEYGYA
ncbi:MAG: hypothetical protein ABEI52_06920 [Halobacteriaceae archaeon]